MGRPVGDKIVVSGLTDEHGNFVPGEPSVARVRAGRGSGVSGAKASGRGSDGKPKRISPETLAKTGSEHGEQAALFCWAAEQRRVEGYAGLEWMFAVPNGGDRDLVVASMLKAEGVKSGVSDIMLPEGRGGYFGLFIEMKRADGGSASEKQLTFMDHVFKMGYAAVLCHGWLQARDAILLYYSWPPTQIIGERMKP